MEYSCVIALALCSILIGSMLGIRFRFVVLLPVIAVGSTALAVISAMQDATLAQAVLSIVVFASLLQFGYIGTALFRPAVTAYASKREAALGSPKLRS